MIHTTLLPEYECVSYNDKEFTMYQAVRSGDPLYSQKILFQANSLDEMKIKMVIFGINEKDVYFLRLMDDKD